MLSPFFKTLSFWPRLKNKISNVGQQKLLFFSENNNIEIFFASRLSLLGHNGIIVFVGK